MIIGICGYGYTGSGAILDLLKEYDGFSQLNDDYEFVLPYYPDGLINLENNLIRFPSRFMSSDIAIMRFEKFIKKYSKSGRTVKRVTKNSLIRLSKNYIESISQVVWNGHWLFDYYEYQGNVFGRFWSRTKRTVQRFFDRHNVGINLIKRRKMSLCYSEELFFNETKKYINSIIDIMFPEKKERIILNQPFPANYPSMVFKYFDDPKAIIVDRDPRDVYILAKKSLKSSSAWIPTDNVKDFVEYYKAMHCRYSEEKKNNNVLLIRFEDLIYNYEMTIKEIEKLIGPLGNKKNISFFDPAISINNTQLFLKYTELSSDINVIEKELKEYLYPFPDYPKPNFKTTEF